MVVFRYIFLRIVCLNEGIAAGAEIVWIISDTMFIVSRSSRSWFSLWTSILLFSLVLINSCSPAITRHDKEPALISAGPARQYHLVTAHTTIG